MKRPQAKPLRFTVAFDEADGEGIVFFGNYFRLVHRALEQYLPLLGIPWSEWFSNREWAVPLRHVEADYLGPLHPGDAFSVEIVIDRIGDSSVHFAYVLRGADGEISARLKTSHVFVERGRKQKLSVPDSIRQRLAAGTT